MTKKILSVLLIFTLIIGLSPVTSIAATTYNKVVYTYCERNGCMEKINESNFEINIENSTLTYITK